MGTKSALDSAIGLPSRPVSAPRMLALLMPEEVRRSFMSAFPAKTAAVPVQTDGGANLIAPGTARYR
jgi:hypothetical protein